jgi:hypothetical protein
MRINSREIEVSVARNLGVNHQRDGAKRGETDEIMSVVIK